MGDIAPILDRICFRRVLESSTGRDFSQRVAGRSGEPAAFQGVRATWRWTLTRTRWIGRLSHSCHWPQRGLSELDMHSPPAEMTAHAKFTSGPRRRALPATSDFCSGYVLK